MKLTHSLLTIAAFAAPVAAQDMHDVIDVSGEPVSVPVDPQRIAIAADRAFTEPVVAAGIMPIAVASQHEFAPHLVAALSDAQELVDLGHHNEIDIEALALAEPDLIIMRSLAGYGDPALYEEASLIAPVVQLSASVGVRELIDDLGAVLGDDVEHTLDAQLDAAVAKMAGAVADPSAITVSHGSISESGISLMMDNSNLASQLIREAGYARPESQTSATDEIENNSRRISWEDIASMDGDILFLNSVNYELDIATLAENPVWGFLDVVQQNRVINSDWRYWNNGASLAADLIAEDFVNGLKAAGLAD